MNDNERPTPLTDAAKLPDGEYRGPLIWADFARTLERSLAERTEERNKLDYKLTDLNLVFGIVKCERDAALAKLVKCREALERVKQEHEHFGYGFEDCRDKVIKTLEETK